MFQSQKARFFELSAFSELTSLFDRLSSLRFRKSHQFPGALEDRLRLPLVHNFYIFHFLSCACSLFRNKVSHFLLLFEHTCNFYHMSFVLPHFNLSVKERIYNER